MAACKRHEDVWMCGMDVWREQEPAARHVDHSFFTFIPVGPPLAVRPSGHRVDLKARRAPSSTRILHMTIY